MNSKGEAEDQQASPLASTELIHWPERGESAGEVLLAGSQCFLPAGSFAPDVISGRMLYDLFRRLT
ncbi:MAG TPA: hypothetical protein VF043_17195 [Ktedonobacteraceae bacterium]